MKKKILKFIFQHPHIYSLYLTARNFDARTFFSIKSYQIKDVVICGMPRSGSTLLFNIIKEMLRLHYTKIDPYFINDKQYNKLLKSEISLVVKKNHRYSPLLKKRIMKGLSIGFFTHRDIRDVVVSLKQIGRIPEFDKWTNRGRLRKIVNDALLYAETRKVTMIEYDQLLNQKKNVIDQLEKRLGLKLTDEEKEIIIQKTDIDKTKKMLESRNESEQIDYSNHLHQNHISDGKVGKWKDILTDDEIVRINNEAKDFLNLFNYK